MPQNVQKSFQTLRYILYIFRSNFHSTFSYLNFILVLLNPHQLISTCLLLAFELGYSIQWNMMCTIYRFFICVRVYVCWTVFAHSRTLSCGSERIYTYKNTVCAWFRRALWQPRFLLFQSNLNVFTDVIANNDTQMAQNKCTLK